jgi:hypothetical protein
MPRAYETELQAVITAMGDMKQPAGAVRWEACGTQGVGVLASDTMMFQRGGPQASDAHLGSFYGLALPLLKHGIPVDAVQVESAAEKGFLDHYRVLLLTYEGQKPPTPEFHAALAAWVRQGGALVVIDDDKDPYNAVHEWWNATPLAFKAPREHLFKELGLAADARGISNVGKGVVLLESASPAALTYQADGAAKVRALAQQAAGAVGLAWKESNALVLRRGPYVIASGLEESLVGAKPVALEGRFIPLFDAGLPVVKRAELPAGRRSVLVDLDAFPRGHEGVVAAACRVREERVSAEGVRFRADGVAESQGVVCVALAAAPKEVRVKGRPAEAGSYEYADGVLRVRFTNAAEGFEVEIRR